VEKCTDCDGVLFIDGLVKCKRVIEDLAGFSVFGVVDDQIYDLLLKLHYKYPILVLISF